jgi:hypothetical protein
LKGVFQPLPGAGEGVGVGAGVFVCWSESTEKVLILFGSECETLLCDRTLVVETATLDKYNKTHRTRTESLFIVVFLGVVRKRRLIDCSMPKTVFGSYYLYDQGTFA